MQISGGAVSKPSASRTKAGEQESAAALSAEAVFWLNELPETVRPMKTCARFPRIVNKFVSLWAKPADCSGFFEELLLDRRGDRQGFPAEVAFELAALKNYFETAVHPSHQTVWDDIIKRGRER
jgi:hypothetical protein